MHGNGAQYGVTGVTRDLYWTVRLMSGTFRRQFPQFPFTSIQINEGFACRPHVDKRNLISLGNHTGGELWVHEADGGVLLSIRPEEGHASGQYRTGTPYPGQVFRPSAGWVVFDGRQLHCTLPFEGERYSLVFFCGPHLDKVPFSVKHEMFEAGFDFDWDEGSVSLAAEACGKAAGVRVPDGGKELKQWSRDTGTVAVRDSRQPPEPYFRKNIGGARRSSSGRFCSRRRGAIL